MMNKYESIFILDPNLSEEDNAALVGKFKSLVESAGQLEGVDLWGKRKLAYEINDQKEGYYVLMNFTADSKFPAELERVYKITDGVLRFITVNKDKR